MARKALLIGCNYPGTMAELKGCINDVKRLHRCLIDRYSFSKDDITVLIDVDDSYVQPTGKNISHALADLLLSTKPSDFLFVHYSGHGTRLPAEMGEEDDTGCHECIVPCDMNLITDNDFREFVNQVPEGCRLAIVSDSCHSGGLIEQAKEQIGESTRNQEDGSSDSGFGFTSFLKQTMQDKLESGGILIPWALRHHQHHGEEEEREVESAYGDRGYVKSRSLPLSTLIKILKQKTGKDDIDVGKLRPALFDIFGEDASPKVKKFTKVKLNKLQHGHGDGEGGGGFMGMVGSLAQEFLKQKLEESDEGYAKPAMEVEVGSYQEVYPGTTKRSFPDDGILISGFQTDQTSAEAWPSGNAHEAYGALSNAILTVFTETDGAITNHDLVMRAREMLESQGFTQRPGLYCSDDHVDAPFIC